MELGDTDRPEDGGVGGVSLSNSSVSCSICLEVVMDNGSRSIAKLQCGHEFHLDCIGSTFNVKGVMQCPNCRKIEKGQWLFANGCRSCPEFGMDNWTDDDGLDDLSYSELPFGIHWCPFGGLTQVPSSLEERALPSTVYRDILRRYAIFTEQRAASLAPHSCPHIAYFQHLQPSSLNFEGISGGPNFNHHWNGLSRLNNISISHTINTIDLHYQSWDHPSPTFSSISNLVAGADQASGSSATLRSTRGGSGGLPRPRSFFHPLLISHGPSPRAGNLVVHPIVPPYTGSDSRDHDRAQALHAYHQQQQSHSPSMPSPMFSNIWRPGGPRPHLGPLMPSSDSARAFNMFSFSGSSGRNLHEVDNPVQNHFYAWEQDRFAPFPLIPVDR